MLTYKGVYVLGLCKNCQHSSIPKPFTVRKAKDEIWCKQPTVCIVKVPKRQKKNIISSFFYILHGEAGAIPCYFIFTFFFSH